MYTYMLSSETRDRILHLIKLHTREVVLEALATDIGKTNVFAGPRHQAASLIDSISTSYSLYSEQQLQALESFIKTHWVPAEDGASVDQQIYSRLEKENSDLRKENYRLKEALEKNQAIVTKISEVLDLVRGCARG